MSSMGQPIISSCFGASCFDVDMRVVCMQSIGNAEQGSAVRTRYLKTHLTGSARFVMAKCRIWTVLIAKRLPTVRKQLQQLIRPDKHQQLLVTMTAVLGKQQVT